MIELKRKQDCCGCQGCEQICPKSCISMSQDSEGFYYPKVDKDNCVDCGLCNKVCPVINNYPSPSIKPTPYACRAKEDEILMTSSSGGFFSIVAEKVIEDGGVVFGAVFDKEWNVYHTYTDKIEELESFRESKYVQSKIGTSYRDVKRFLNEGRKVLFTGTPCQVAGLSHFLNKDYDNLIRASPKILKRNLTI